MTPTIDEIVVGDEPDSWRAAGFAVDPDGTCRIGDRAGAPRGPLRGQAHPALVPARRDRRRPRRRRHRRAGHDHQRRAAGRARRPPQRRALHRPRGAAVTDPARTTAALEAVGFDVRQVRETDSYGAPMRQTFFRAGEVIIELIGPEEPGRRSRPAFFGLAYTVDDLDATARRLGPALGAGQGRGAARPAHRLAAPQGARHVGGHRVHDPRALIAVAGTRRPDLSPSGAR